MNSIKNLLFTLSLSGLIISCGGGDDLESKKAQLAELRSQSVEINTKIKSLENEIAKEDPEYGTNTNNTVLVSVMPLKTMRFEHKIEVRGTVESRKNVMVSAEISGRIEAIKVKEGQTVKKGETLVVLDAKIIRNNIAELNTSLELANVVFERQSNLWAKKIGTEIQYLEAKNSKESLERKLATAKSQLAQAVISAPFAGSVDEIPVKVGEMATPGAGLIRVVNPEDMYIKGDVSEIYIGKFESDETVDIHFPSQNKDIVSNISSVSQVINSENRTFSVEIDLPQLEFMVKPNQVSVLQLTDYTNDSAYTVSTKLIQRDDKGTFIYIAKKDGEALKAKKTHIKTGLSFNSKTEIISGISGNEQVIDRGFRDVTDGVEIKISTGQTASN